ncbi:MAG: VOC family protein [Candidatus Gracilibacteria bacterium]
MFKNAHTFSSFSTDNIEKAKEFYGDILGLEIKEDKEMGLLGIHLKNGGEIMIYPKNDHTPATFTVLNFNVDDIEKSVDELTSKGVKFEQYHQEGLTTNEKGISRSEYGPTAVAWFKDNAGNIISVIQE